MPRSFSDGERESIRDSLMKKGRELFSRYGIRGTSVEDLARAAGIASGSFYAFYASKEELYFDILEDEEKGREAMLGKLLAFDRLTADNFYAFISGVFTMMENNPVIRRLYMEGELELLMRKLPRQRMEAHMERDSGAMKELFEAWRKEGCIIDEEPEVLAALFRGLFFISFHRSEIGEAYYPKVRDLLLRFVSGGIVKGDCDDRGE